MSAVQSAVTALTKDRRTDHFLDVKTAARSLNIHENKVSEWVYRTGEKIKQIYRDQPGLMAAQMALWAAQAEAEKQDVGSTGRNRVA